MPEGEQAKADRKEVPQGAGCPHGAILPTWAKDHGRDVRRRTRLTRRIPLRKTAWQRAQGQRSVTGRLAATSHEWTAIREVVLARADWACQACGSRGRLDVHHVTKRSHGGSDLDLDGLVALCRACHERTDAPYGRGRLVVTPLGEGRFTFALRRGAGKWASTVVDQWESLWPPSAGTVCPHRQNRGFRANVVQKVPVAHPPVLSSGTSKTTKQIHDLQTLDREQR